MKLYYGGKVYTGEDFCEAFAVENGKFSFAGSNEEAKNLNADEKIDLGGKFVCAGFNDSHMHLLNFGQALKCADLASHTSSLKEMIEYLADFASNGSFSENEWLVGRGWNQDYFEDENRMPTKEDLDKISTDYPILITRACGHCCVVNSKAISLAGVTGERVPKRR